MPTSLRAVIVLLLLGGAEGCCVSGPCARYTQAERLDRFVIKATFEDDGGFTYIVVDGDVTGHIPLASDTGYRRSLAVRLPANSCTSAPAAVVLEGVMVTFKFRHPDVAKVVAGSVTCRRVATDRAEVAGSVTLEGPHGETAELEIDRVIAVEEGSVKVLRPRATWEEYQVHWMQRGTTRGQAVGSRQPHNNALSPTACAMAVVADAGAGLAPAAG